MRHIKPRVLRNAYALFLLRQYCYKQVLTEVSLRSFNLPASLGYSRIDFNADIYTRFYDGLPGIDMRISRHNTDNYVGFYDRCAIMRPVTHQLINGTRYDYESNKKFAKKSCEYFYNNRVIGYIIAHVEFDRRPRLSTFKMTRLLIIILFV